MFFHDKRLQYHARPERPDPIYANKLQEVLGGQFGEISVMMQYLFQGWNCRGPMKYRDMLLDIGTEEMAHVEMLSTMICRLLESAPESVVAQAAGNPAVEAVLGGGRMEDVVMNAGMNPQHFIVNGLGAAPNDSVGFPWTARYIISSGNLMADFRANLNAESQGRLQVVRLFELTDDTGVRDMLSFLIARDTMHQNQWMAAIEELQRDGLDQTPCPATFPLELEKREVAYQFWNCSMGDQSAEGRWANGASPDGMGEFQYIADPQPLGEMPVPEPAAPAVHGTNPMPLPPSVGGVKASMM